MRIRWLNSDRFDYADLRRATLGIAREPFVEDVNSGFLLERKRISFLEGKYIERFDWVETVSDPFGGNQEIPRREYKQTAFKLSAESPTLEVYNPPRSISPLLNRLEVVLDSEFVVDSPDVDVLFWLKEMEAEIEQVIVSSVTISKLSLSPRTAAQVTISGTEDVRGRIAAFVGKRTYKIDKLVVMATHAGETVKFLLGCDSRANIITGSDGIIQLMRKGLATVLTSVKV